MPKYKGRGVKIQLEGTLERRAEKIPRVQRGRQKEIAAAERRRGEVLAAAAGSRCGSRCSRRRRRARRRRRGGDCTATARSCCVWGSVASSAPALCASHPALLLSAAPPPSAARPRRWESTVSASCLDQVAQPRREVIRRLPWWVLPSGLREGAPSSPDN